MKVEKPDQLDAVPKVVSLETRKGAKELVFKNDGISVKHIVSVSPESLRGVLLNLVPGKTDSESLTIRALDLAFHANRIAKYYKIQLETPYSSNDISQRLRMRDIYSKGPKLMVGNTHVTWDGVKHIASIIDPVVGVCLINELEGLAQAKFNKQDRPPIENIKSFGSTLHPGMMTDEVFSYPGVQSATFLNGKPAISSLWLTALLQGLMDREGKGKTIQHKTVIISSTNLSARLKHSGMCHNSHGGAIRHEIPSSDGDNSHGRSRCHEIPFDEDLSKVVFYCVVKSEYLSSRGRLENMTYMSNDVANLVGQRFSEVIRIGVYEAMRKAQYLLDILFSRKVTEPTPLSFLPGEIEEEYRNNGLQELLTLESQGFYALSAVIIQWQKATKKKYEEFFEIHNRHTTTEKLKKKALETNTGVRHAPTPSGFTANMYHVSVLKDCFPEIDLSNLRTYSISISYVDPN